jgi:hypothetical protein
LDFGTLLFLGFLWFLFNLLKGGGKPGSAPPTPRQGPQGLPPRTLPPPSGVDATQHEGARLEGLLRDLGRTLDEAARVRTTLSTGQAGEEDVEERESLETVSEPEAVSLEREVRRAERAPVDQDDQAAAVVSRRIAAAAARNAAHTPADHRGFDRKIRQEPADHTAVAARSYTAQQLRDAVVWREILGPPASLRPDAKAD